MTNGHAKSKRLTGRQETCGERQTGVVNVGHLSDTGGGGDGETVQETIEMRLPPVEWSPDAVAPVQICRIC